MGRGQSQNTQEVSKLRQVNIEEIELAGQEIKASLETASEAAEIVEQKLAEAFNNYEFAGEKIAEMGDKTIKALVRDFQTYAEHTEDCADSDKCSCGYAEAAERVEALRRFF